MLASAIAEEANVPAQRVKRMLAAMGIVLVRELKDKGKSNIGKIVRFSVKVKPARKERRKHMFGEIRLIPARGETKLVRAKVGKILRDAMQ